jgi:hypothetical protein
MKSLFVEETLVELNPRGGVASVARFTEHTLRALHRPKIVVSRAWHRRGIGIIMSNWRHGDEMGKVLY